MFRLIIKPFTVKSLVNNILIIMDVITKIYHLKYSLI